MVGANTMKKDVTLVYPNIDKSLYRERETSPTEAVGCGWSKIRIIAVSKLPYIHFAYKLIFFFSVG